MSKAFSCNSLTECFYCLISLIKNSVLFTVFAIIPVGSDEGESPTSLTLQDFLKSEALKCNPNMKARSPFSLESICNLRHDTHDRMNAVICSHLVKHNSCFLCIQLEILFMLHTNSFTSVQPLRSQLVGLMSPHQISPFLEFLGKCFFIKPLDMDAFLPPCGPKYGHYTAGYVAFRLGTHEHLCVVIRLHTSSCNAILSFSA